MKLLSAFPLVLSLLAAPAALAIYPDDHWNHVKDLTVDNFESTLQSEVDAGRTMFAPTWNAITKAFQEGNNNSDVSFGDVNLSEQQIRGEPHNPGAGGWPTIRYFNKETGTEGASYIKRTQEAMCTELGDKDMLTDYIETYGNTVLCDAETGKNCSAKEKAYVAKMKESGEENQRSQLARLEKMDDKTMAEDLAMWAFRRKRILRQLVGETTHQEKRVQGDEL